MTDPSTGPPPDESDEMDHADLVNGEGRPDDHKTGKRQAAENRSNDPPA